MFHAGRDNSFGSNDWIPSDLTESLQCQLPNLTSIAESHSDLPATVWDTLDLSKYTDLSSLTQDSYFSSEIPTCNGFDGKLEHNAQNTFSLPRTSSLGFANQSAPLAFETSDIPTSFTVRDEYEADGLSEGVCLASSLEEQVELKGFPQSSLQVPDYMYFLPAPTGHDLTELDDLALPSTDKDQPELTHTDNNKDLLNEIHALIEHLYQEIREARVPSIVLRSRAKGGSYRTISYKNPQSRKTFGSINER